MPQTTTMQDFGPGTANMFRKMVGLSELSWVDQQQIQKTSATTTATTKGETRSAC